MKIAERIHYKSVPGKAEMWSDKDGISWLVFMPGSEISLEDMEAIVKLAKTTITPDEQVKVLADISEVENISSEARVFASSGELSPIYSCLAIVASTPATRLVGNFFLHFHKPPRPVKIFNSIPEAKTWLMKCN